MLAPAFELAFASTAVKALLGTSPLRFYPFGEAPQTVTKPYAVWTLAFGSPYNTLACRPDADSFGIQVDVYALTATQARTVAEALRDAFEGDAYVTRWGGESRDDPTSNYRVSFDVEFITPR